MAAQSLPARSRFRVVPLRLDLHRPLTAAAVELTADDLREIDTAASKIEVRGARLPEAALQMTGR
jgi:hypothetical protein